MRLITGRQVIGKVVLVSGVPVRGKGAVSPEVANVAREGQRQRQG
jgi:hypothetical protein